MARVLFSQGTSDAFATLVKDSNTLYFLTDTHEIYLGGVRYAFGEGSSDLAVNIVGSGDCVVNAEFNSSTNTLTITKGNAGDLASIQTLLSSFVESVSGATGSAIVVDNTDSQNPVVSLNIASGQSAGNVTLTQSANGLSANVTLPDDVESVSAESGSAITVDNTDPQNPVVGLHIASGAAAGNVTLTQNSNGLSANVTIPQVPVDGVKTGEKVLSLDGTKLQSTLTVATATHDSKTWVQLKGISDQLVSEFDASAFIVDGMLDSVTLEDGTGSLAGKKVLHFVFNTDAGKQDIYVDVTDLVNVYGAAAGGGLSLNANNEFSINNSVTAGSVVQGATLAYGQSTAVTVATYDAHGLVTGSTTVNFTLPALPAPAEGSVGLNDNTKVVTYANLTSSGFNGSTLNISNTAPTETPASTEIASTTAVYNAMAMWDTFGPPPQYYVKLKSTTPFTIHCEYTEGKLWDGDIEYSTDADTWTSWEDPTSEDLSSGSGTEIYLRGSNNTIISGELARLHYTIFDYRNATSLQVSGNIEALLDYNLVAAGQHPTPGKDCFTRLFSRCSSLVSVSEDLFSTMTSITYEGCYAMFQECESLVNVPALPAMNLAQYSYRDMFFGCISLESIPELPATNVPYGCYEEMFKDCSLIKLSNDMTSTYSTPYVIPSSGTGSGSDQSNMFEENEDFSGNIDLNTTYYTSNTVVPANS